LQTTGFLVIGLLTLWIYTVVNFYKILSDHAQKRLRYFKGEIQDNKPTGVNHDAISEISKKGFSIDKFPRDLTIALFFISAIFLISIIPQQVLCSYGYIRWSVYDISSILTVGFAVTIFCCANIYFLYWFSRTVKNHEYNELLFARLLLEPNSMENSQPSSLFIKRWNKVQNSVVLFAILSIPLVISPLFSIKYIHLAINDPSETFFTIYIIWTIIVCISIAIFHLWGTTLLVRIYNEHLQIEKLNAESLQKNHKWAPNNQASVIEKKECYKSENENEANFAPIRTLAAIMITDVVGFSKQMELNEENTYKKLLNHNEIIRKIISANYGEEIKTIGDAFLVRFNSAVDAVRSGVEIQQNFAKHNKVVQESEQIHIRIGIHIGDVLMMGKDVIGNGVNIAARIEPLSDPGGICISSDVYNVIKKSIDIKVNHIGKRELKNINDAPELYKIIIDSIEQGETS